MRRWLEARSDEQIFNASVGNDPSLADVVRMVHPKPASKSREALYGYLIGRATCGEDLPAVVRDFEEFKAGRADRTPDVPFQMLTALDLSTEHWRQIARRAPWQVTRMNLNTFARHGVFDGGELDQVVAARLRDRAAIEAAGVFPYQLLVARAMADERVPACVRDALQEAVEMAVGNVPAIAGQVYVCPDVSGSMRSPITGFRAGDMVILVSDNESWVDARAGRGTELMRQWQVFRGCNPKAKLVCLDIQPYGTTQAVEGEDILNIGGFSDKVFEVLGQFADGTLTPDHWVGVVEGVALQ